MTSIWLLLLLLLLSGQTAVSDAWKPVVHQAPGNAAITGSKATSTALTSSLSHQQLHPEFGSKISYVLGSDNKEVQQSLAKELLAVKNSYKTPVAVAAVPSSINFGDAKFGYMSTGYEEDQCSVKKYAFNEDGVVYYDNKIPELTQFTICFWMRFTNHSGDHVVLTYTKDEHRDFQFWVANAKNSSFLSMAIKGQQMYRLNYPLRVRQWHHTCTSWNGKTGEWQIWLKAERIGRGFHNSLVGHKIPAGGRLYSGGTSVTGKICDGLHFEVTLVQIYRVALSAGKAHRDHKHHHAHHFDHDGQEIQLTTKPTSVINRPQPMHSQLANGQIPTRVRINLAQPGAVDGHVDVTPANPGAQQSLTIHTNFANGQINAGSRLVAQQLIGLNHKLAIGPQTTQTVNRQALYDPTHHSKVQFVDETETRILFKRHAASATTKSDSQTKGEDKNLKKRGLVFLDDGSIVNDPLNEGTFKYDGLAEFGGQQFKDDLSGKINIEDEIMEHDREPAEEEVKAVSSLCNACKIEPFQGAIVFAWKDAHEKLDNVLKGYSVGGCGQF